MFAGIAPGLPQAYRPRILVLVEATMPEPVGVETVSPLRPRAFAEYSAVTLKRSLIHDNVTFPAGTRGVVVHRHRDGIGYEVEFSRPVEAVLTVMGADLIAE
jgi:hypothetical protein